MISKDELDKHVTTSWGRDSIPPPRAEGKTVEHALEDLCVPDVTSLAVGLWGVSREGPGDEEVMLFIKCKVT